MVALSLVVSVACSSKSDDNPTGKNDGGTTTDGEAGADAGDGASPNDCVESTKPEVQFLGRVDRSDPEKPRLSWPGAQIKVRFKGTDLKMSFKETPFPGNLGTGVDNYSQYSVIVDGAETKIIKLKSGSLPDQEIATGLADAEHEVILYRRTESSFGYTQFFAADVGAGQLLPPKCPPKRKMEFIGDSITVGYGADKRGPYDGNETLNPGEDYVKGTECMKRTDTETVVEHQIRQDAENNGASYGAVLAKTFNAEAHFVAWSGKGVARNLDGTAENTIPVLYDRAFATEENPKWDASKWAADIVVINLGTNDFRNFPGTPITDFVEKYTALVAKVRTNYPNAHIYCVVGPMLSYFDPDGTGPKLSEREQAKVYLSDGVVTPLKTAGDAKIHYIEVDQDYKNLGCEYHPHKDSHAQIAQKIANEIKLDVGWK